MKTLVGLSSILLTTGIAVFAGPVTPTYTTFGELTGATWSGSGNPNNPVAITTINNDNNTITLGLAAQQRYSNPPLANNGAGTFYATPGENYGSPATPTTPGTPSNYQGATWNFDFYFDATGGSYTYKLLYGTDASSLITIDPALIGDNGATPNSGGQNSENLLFGNFGGVGNTLAFDPNASAIYSFELEAFDSSGALIGTTAINVNVGAVPDTGNTVCLLGLAFLGLALIGFRQHRRQQAS